MKITINRAQVQAKVMGAWEKGLPLLSEAVLNDCNKYVKVRSHALEQSAVTHSELDKGKLIWETPYARRQYWEIQTAYTDVNPNASWQWCEVAKTRHKRQWDEQAQRLMEMNL